MSKKIRNGNLLMNFLGTAAFRTNLPPFSTLTLLLFLERREVFIAFFEFRPEFKGGIARDLGLTYADLVPFMSGSILEFPTALEIS